MTPQVRGFRFGTHDVAAGDPIRVKPSKPGKRDGFVGRVRSAALDDLGVLVEVTVYGGPAGRPAAARTFAPARLQWCRRNTEPTR